MISFWNPVSAIYNFVAISCLSNLYNYLAGYLCSQVEKNQLYKTDVFIYGKQLIISVSPDQSKG